MNINIATIGGRLGADPEVRTFQNGGTICNLRIATTDQWKDKSGEKKERTEWHAVTVHGDGLVKFCETYLRKGARVFIQGEIQTRKWQDQSGNDRYSTEIVVRGYGGKVIPIDWPDSREEYTNASKGGPSPETVDRAHFPSGGPAASGVHDDEIPF